MRERFNQSRPQSRPHHRQHLDLLPTVGVIRNETLVSVNFSAQDASIWKISVAVPRLVFRLQHRDFPNWCILGWEIDWSKSLISNDTNCSTTLPTSATRHSFILSQAVPTRTFVLLKVSISAFMIKDLLSRHYTKQVHKHGKFTWNWDACPQRSLSTGRLRIFGYLIACRS